MKVARLPHRALEHIDPRRSGVVEDPVQPETLRNVKAATQTETVKAIYSKLEAYGARLALMIHMVRVASGDDSLKFKGKVDRDSVAPAAELVDWFAREAQRVYDMLDEDDRDTERLRLNPDYFTLLANAPALSPSEREVPDLLMPDELFVNPPDAVLPPPVTNKPWLTKTARRFDFREQDARNSTLGKGGERLVVELERRRLNAAGRDDFRL